MNLDQHPASESIGFLRQGADLIRTLDDEVFTRTPGPGFRGGVGGQFRHCIDFYECLLRDLERGNAVDYANRAREADLETDRALAAERFERLADRLAAIDPASLDRSVSVRSETPMPGVPEWCGSTVYRELQFLVSHTVHHYALIVALLGRLGYDLEPRFADFGVAPSTLAHWKEAGPLAG